MNGLKNYSIFDLFEETNWMLSTLADKPIPETHTDLSHYPVDISYDDTGLFLDFVAIGGTKDAFDIQTAPDGLLLIKYEAPKVTTNRKYITNKIVSKNLNTSIRIGAKYDLDSIQVDYTNGVLHIFVPVAESKKPKKVEIN